MVSGCTTTPRVFHSHGMKTGNGVVGTGQAVVGEKGNALARVGALTRALLWGDIHAGIGRCQGLVGTGTDALPWVTATRRKGTGGMGSENAPCCRPPDALRAPVQVRVDIYRDTYAPAAGRFNERLRIDVVDGRLEMQGNTIRAVAPGQRGVCAGVGQCPQEGRCSGLKPARTANSSIFSSRLSSTRWVLICQ